MSKSPTEIHNDGQQDASEDNGYNPPHGVLDRLCAGSSEEDRMIEENAAYSAGYKSATD